MSKHPIKPSIKAINRLAKAFNVAAQHVQELRLRIEPTEDLVYDKTDGCYKPKAEVNKQKLLK